MKHKLQGNRILIKLETFPDETSKSGLVVPLYVDGVTDGGQPVSRINEFPLSTVGSVIQISEGAKKTLEESSMTISIGDRVSIQPHSLSRGNYFYMNPDRKVIDITDEDERHVAVSPVNIISIIED